MDSLKGEYESSDDQKMQILNRISCRGIKTQACILQANKQEISFNIERDIVQNKKLGRCLKKKMPKNR